MEIEQAMAFVRQRSKCVLTTLRKDGRPHLSNVFYGVGADDSILISLTDSRIKTKFLRRDPRVALHVTDESFWQYAVLDGVAALTPIAQAPDDPTVDALVEYYRRTGGEHSDWADYRRTMVSERRLLATITVNGVYGQLP
jgi:PPOX class probable F420-dependent enzyme